MDIQTLGASHVAQTAQPQLAEQRRDSVKAAAQAESGSDAAAAAAVTAAASKPANPAEAPADRKQLEAAVDRIKEFVQPINKGIQFALDEDTGRSLVKVIDTQTKEVLRQIPTEEALHIAKALDKLQGLLIQNKA